MTMDAYDPNDTRLDQEGAAYESGYDEVDVDGGARDASDERVELLTAEIDETRDELGETVQAIGDKLEPANLAREASETVRQATTGKVEQMAIGAQETWRDVRTGNTGSIVDTVRSNPIPAGMVALGLGLLFMNRGASASGRDGTASGYGYAPSDYPRGRASWEPDEWDRRRGASAAERIGWTVSGAADQAGDAVGRVTGRASETVGQVVDSVGQTASQLPDQAGRMVDERAGQVRRMIDENPLAAGAVALAAGAALGMLIPSTRIERDAIGDTRDRLVEQAESTVNEALDQADQGMASRGPEDGQQGGGTQGGGTQGGGTQGGGTQG